MNIVAVVDVVQKKKVAAVLARDDQTRSYMTGAILVFTVVKEIRKSFLKVIFVGDCKNPFGDINNLIINRQAGIWTRSCIA